MKKTKCIPNFKIPCDICGQKPTVTRIDEETRQITNTGLCGVCTWGESELIDCEKWNDKTEGA